MLTSFLAIMAISGSVFLSFKRHVLAALISLEALVLVRYIALSVGCITSCVPSLNIASMLTFRVCRASVGLSLLVILCRTHGKDLVSRFNLS